MSDISISTDFKTETDPIKLENRRREICLLFVTKYKGYDDPEAPVEMLRELSFITSKLRRKQSGAPARKPSTKKSPITLDDLGL